MARLEQNLTKIAALSPGAAKAALLQTGADVVNLVKQLSPVDTGYLRKSYGADPVSRTEIHIGSDAEYAGYVEFGTIYSPAQPHLIPALVRSQNIMIARLTEEMKKLT